MCGWRGRAGVACYSISAQSFGPELVGKPGRPRQNPARIGESATDMREQDLASEFGGVRPGRSACSLTLRRAEPAELLDCNQLRN
jgi:hypothetical protein